MTDCIFCKIACGDIPSDKIYEDDNFFAIKDINPSYPVHYLIITKPHIASVNEIDQSNEFIFKSVFTIARNIAEKLGVNKSGYRLVINSGDDSGQEVKHFHMHLLGGEKVNKL